MVPRGAPFLVMSKKTLDMLSEVAAKRRASVGAKAICLLGVRTTHGVFGDTDTYTIECGGGPDRVSFWFI